MNVKIIINKFSPHCGQFKSSNIDKDLEMSEFRKRVMQYTPVIGQNGSAIKYNTLVILYSYNTSNEVRNLLINHIYLKDILIYINSKTLLGPTSFQY